MRFRLLLLAPLLLGLLFGTLPAEARKKRRGKARRPRVQKVEAPAAVAKPALPEKPSAPRPWARGVPQEDQDRATSLFTEGNAFFEKRQYPQALERYSEALGHWDHPAINFNTTVCLVHLGRSLEAHRTLERALAFDEAPLGEALYAQALTYQKLLEGQLARLELRCEQPGVTVTLDGEPTLRCPGEHQAWVEARNHQLVARGEGFATQVRTQTLAGGETSALSISLIPIAEAVRTVRRYPRWIPWTVLGAGLALGGGALGLEQLSRADARRYDAAVIEECPGGCVVATVPSLQRVGARANREHLLAITAGALGGAVVIAGGTLLVLNLPRQVPLEEGEMPPLQAGLQVAPGGAWLTLRGSF